MDLLVQIHDAWNERRSELIYDATMIADDVTELNAVSGQVSEVGDKAIQRAASILLRSHDNKLGGFGRRTKFPQESRLFLLLDRVKRSGDQKMLSAVEHSLSAMAHGGIYD